MVCIMLQACLQNHGSSTMLVDQMVDSEANTLQVCMRASHLGYHEMRMRISHV